MGKGRRSFGTLNGKLLVFPALSNLELAVQSVRLTEVDKERKNLLNELNEVLRLKSRVRECISMSLD